MKPKKQTSDRVSRIASECMRMLRENPRERWFGVTRGQLNALAGSVLSQDEVKGPRKKFTVDADFTGATGVNVGTLIAELTRRAQVKGKRKLKRKEATK